jgi:Cu2+-exporting ATPase
LRRGAFGPTSRKVAAPGSFDVGAAGYNIVAIPLAAGVLARWGIVLSPAIGAVLMSLSTIIVAINAQLLRRDRLE